MNHFASVFRNRVAHELQEESVNSNNVTKNDEDQHFALSTITSTELGNKK